MSEPSVALAREAFSVEPFLPIRLRRLRRHVAAAIDRALGLAALTRRYHRLPEAVGPAEFARLALVELGVVPRFEVSELAHVPRTGPCIVVANHPHGGLDGLVLMDVLLARRQDARFMANHFLAKFAELRSLFLQVDPFGGQRAVYYNIGAARSARNWLQAGGMLVLFPGGEVSSFSWRERRIVDPEWDTGVARLVAQRAAPVVPAFIEGRNSTLFQAAGLIHPRIRTALLAREMLDPHDRTIRVKFGRAVEPALLADLDGRDQVTRYLRTKTYLLAATDRQRISVGRAAVPARRTTPIAPRIGAGALAAEIGRLAADQRLLTSGACEVYWAGAAQIPWTLQEIGRLREIAFREVGEGTGKPADIDLYDAYYRHLFVWNAEAREIVGGYRLGHADEIVKAYGPAGLYVQSLFKLAPGLSGSLNQALELGRSFVRPEYQRNYSSLMLLWKGIATYVARNPRYRVLFGPVSISNDYHPISQEILVQFLKQHSFENRRASLVKPRHPFRPKGRLIADLVDLDSVDLRLVADLLDTVEQDDRGVPVLLRQYLKFGGRILGFNIDPEFNDAIDCLLWVDLMDTELPLLRKYMGIEGAAVFHAVHGAPAARLSGRA